MVLAVFFKTVLFDLFEMNFQLNDLNIGDFGLSEKKMIDNRIYGAALLLIDDGKSQPLFEDDQDRQKSIYRKMNFIKTLS